MRLHHDKKLFKQAIQFASDQMQIPSIYVEKDYWVTFALFHIYNDAIGSDTVFKGGTALSKCYGVIERFSEDIDLIVLRREGESKYRLTTKIKTIGKVVKNVLPEIDIPELTRKMGMNRKTAHSYSKAFHGNYGQVRDVIVIEATWLGLSEPHTTRSVCSFVGKMMIDSNQYEMASRYNLLPFDVLALEPTRTICEKIMSLVRFSFGDNPIENLQNKIRHIYDLHLLLSKKEFLSFFNSKEFDAMLIKVAHEDAQSFKNNNKWLKNHPSLCLVFENPTTVWNDLKSTYENDFVHLVYGDFPPEKELLGTLEMIKKRLSTIVWTIEIA